MDPFLVFLGTMVAVVGLSLLLFVYCLTAPKLEDPFTEREEEKENEK